MGRHRTIALSFLAGVLIAASGVAVSIAAGEDGPSASEEETQAVLDGGVPSGAKMEAFEKPNSIPAGFSPDPELLKYCESVPPDDFPCRVLRAAVAGDLEPGDYSDAELEEMLERSEAGQAE
jgi:hypothetical protein